MLMGVIELTSVLLDADEGFEAALHLVEADVNRLKGEKEEVKRKVEKADEILSKEEAVQQELEESREKAKDLEEKLEKKSKAWEDMRKKLKNAVKSWEAMSDDLKEAKAAFQEQREEKDNLVRNMGLAFKDAFEQGYLSASATPYQEMDMVRMAAILQGQAYVSIIPFSLSRSRSKQRRKRRGGRQRKEMRMKRLVVEMGVRTAGKMARIGSRMQKSRLLLRDSWSFTSYLPSWINSQEMTPVVSLLKTCGSL